MPIRISPISCGWTPARDNGCLPPPNSSLSRHFGTICRSNGGASEIMSVFPRHSENEAWFTPERIVLMVLAAITAIVFYLCYRMVEPFVPALAWALAIAVVSHPLHASLQHRLGGGSLVAGLTVRSE